VGRIRTAPNFGSRPQSLDLAFVSCQRWEDGYYSTYRHLADEDLDFVLHLGDYLYEGDIAADGKFRRTTVPESARPAPRSLDQWRIRYALYRSDPDLQRAHARFPFVCTWDDHDVQDGWAARSRRGTATSPCSVSPRSRPSTNTYRCARPPSRRQPASGFTGD
jgi:alkaline phosphatase D